MRYLSVCSGIEAASVAWKDFGWDAVGFSEIEKFPSEVLKYHYPNVPNLGDMNHYKEWDIGAIDILVGGTPCQPFSVAGLRQGLEDPRGNLALIYCGILDKFRPQWFIWENVPGVFSSNEGRDFGSFLGAVAELGYGWAYRVLDAQYFGVAQRRRRVFVVGSLNGWRDCAEVLFEPDSLSRHTPPSRKKREDITASSGIGVEISGPLSARDYKDVGTDGLNKISAKMIPVAYENHPSDSRVQDMGDVCQTVTSTWGTGGGNTPFVQAFSIREDAKANTFSATPLETSVALQALMPSVQSHHAQTFISHFFAVRRLVPLECERLQGFPDNYTNIKENCPDGPRYKALGNSMAVPVMKWIGQKLKKVNDAKTKGLSTGDTRQA
jgi:DNA (cytosine-5)-methyltransferase 1